MSTCIAILLACAIAQSQARPYDAREGLGSAYLQGATFTGFDPCLDPSGERVVFTSLAYDSSEIVSVRRDGTERTRLTKTPFWERSPRWLPDGAHILFYSDEEDRSGEAYVMRADGRERRRLSAAHDIVMGAYAFGYAVAFSPSGDRIAAIVNRGGSHEIAQGPIDASGEWMVSSFGRACFGPVFDPSGSSLYFGQTWIEHSALPPRRVELFSTEAGALEALPRTDDREQKRVIGVVTGPDRIVFLLTREGLGEIWSMRLDGSHRACLAAPERGAYYAALSVPEKVVVYVASNGKGHGYDVFSVSTEGGAPRRLTALKADLSDLTMSPGGREVAFVLTDAGDVQGHGEICLLPVAGGPLLRVCRND